MAKTQGKTTSASALMDRVRKYDPKAAVIDQYTPIDEANVRFAPTGNYMLNAHFSGSILKGAPMGKIVTVCGEPKAGKSYVLLNIAREVQKAGYTPYYIETEFSHDKNRFMLQGIDTTSAIISQPTTVEQLIKIVNPLVNDYMEFYNKGQFDQIPKICFFLDSRSGLMSQQQLDSFSDGEPKANMGTDIQTYDNFMKSIAVNLGKLGWGFIVASHVKIEEVKIQGRSFTKRKPKGGFGQIFMSSTISMMWKKDERDEDDKSHITGIRVTVDVYESRYVKHRPISFFLPNDRPMNPLDGLEPYITWGICKIGKGKWVEVTDIHAKLVAKKVISATSTNIETDHFKSLSKDDQEFAPEFMQHMVDLGLMTATISQTKTTWTITDKYAPGADLGRIAVSNPGSPKYIAAHMPGQYFTHEELMAMDENGESKVFTQFVLEAIDVYVRADFEIGAKSLKDADFFEGE